MSDQAWALTMIAYDALSLIFHHAWSCLISTSINHDGWPTLDQAWYINHEQHSFDIKHEQDWCQPGPSMISILIKLARWTMIKLASSTMIKLDIKYDKLSAFLRVYIQLEYYLDYNVFYFNLVSSHSVCHFSRNFNYPSCTYGNKTANFGLISYHSCVEITFAPSVSEEYLAQDTTRTPDVGQNNPRYLWI